jgi:hypothetical protein
MYSLQIGRFSVSRQDVRWCTRVLTGSLSRSGIELAAMSRAVRGTTEDAAVSGQQIGRVAPWWFVGFGSLFLLGLAALLGGDAWVERTAVIGTAIGTLALAIATQALATKTEESVRHSAELAETGREQLRTATQELAAARDEAQAAGRAARAAERAQVDALAPLLIASIAWGKVKRQHGAGPAAEPEVVSSSAPLAGDLRGLHVFIECDLTLANIGRLPANVVTKEQTALLQGRISLREVSFGPHLDRTTVEEFILPLPLDSFVVPGQDQIPLRFTVAAPPDDLGASVEVKFAFDVSGPLAAATDTLIVRANVTPLVDRGAGFIPHETPVQIVEHRLQRAYLED